MNLHHVSIIINPASGVDFPILAYINRAMKEQKLMWEVMITKKKGDATAMAADALQQSPDAVIVCGGDGTVLEVARVLYTSKVPLLILPAGTANVVAKELGIPSDIPEALSILSRKQEVKEVDVAKLNHTTPLFLRVEGGITANMIKNTKRNDKDRLGAMAYPITAVSELLTAKTATYTMRLDGKEYCTTGVAMMIANMGNIGLPGISLQPSMNCFDGLLDIFVLESSDISSLVGLGTSALMGRPKPESLQHWRAKEISMHIDPPQSVIADDQALSGSDFEVSMLTDKLRVLV